VTYRWIEQQVRDVAGAVGGSPPGAVAR
jgi:hypothetical protein